MVAVDSIVVLLATTSSPVLLDCEGCQQAWLESVSFDRQGEISRSS